MATASSLSTYKVTKKADIHAAFTTGSQKMGSLKKNQIILALEEKKHATIPDLVWVRFCYPDTAAATNNKTVGWACTHSDNKGKRVQMVIDKVGIAKTDSFSKPGSIEVDPRRSSNQEKFKESILPAGWERAQSRSTGEEYYINSLTGESQWEWPDAAVDAGMSYAEWFGLWLARHDVEDIRNGIEAVLAASDIDQADWKETLQAMDPHARHEFFARIAEETTGSTSTSRPDQAEHRRTDEATDGFAAFQTAAPLSMEPNDNDFGELSEHKSNLASLADLGTNSAFGAATRTPDSNNLVSSMFGEFDDTFDRRHKPMQAPAPMINSAEDFGNFDSAAAAGPVTAPMTTAGAFAAPTSTFGDFGGGIPSTVAPVPAPAPAGTKELAEDLFAVDDAAAGGKADDDAFGDFGGGIPSTVAPVPAPAPAGTKELAEDLFAVDDAAAGGKADDDAFGDFGSGMPSTVAPVPAPAPAGTKELAEDLFAVDDAAAGGKADDDAFGDFGGGIPSTVAPVPAPAPAGTKELAEDLFAVKSNDWDQTNLAEDDSAGGGPRLDDGGGDVDLAAAAAVQLHGGGGLAHTWKAEHAGMSDLVRWIRISGDAGHGAKLGARFVGVKLSGESSIPERQIIAEAFSTRPAVSEAAGRFLCLRAGEENWYWKPGRLASKPNGVIEFEALDATGGKPAWMFERLS
eukprot:SAG31_NODE_1878_length_7006_cov_19.371652_3_plen_687_part_00